MLGDGVRGGAKGVELGVLLRDGWHVGALSALTKGPAAGTYAAVQVLSSAGLVPVNGASPIIVNLSTTNVTPSSGLN